MANPSNIFRKLNNPSRPQSNVFDLLLKSVSILILSKWKTGRFYTGVQVWARLSPAVKAAFNIVTNTSGLGYFRLRHTACDEITMYERFQINTTIAM